MTMRESLPPRRRRRKLGRLLLVVVGVAFGLVVLVIVLAVVTSGGGDKPGTDSGTPAPASRHASSQPTQETTTAAAIAPRPADFELTVKIMKKECFGSAGCNITYRIVVGYGGPTIDPSTTYSVTYEIAGGEDTQINTFTITGDQYEVDSEELIGTKSSSAKLTARVTDVTPG